MVIFAARLTGNELKNAVLPTDTLKIQFAFACLGLEEWQKALDIFETFKNRPILIGHRGPWGAPSIPILTAGEVAKELRSLDVRR